MNISLEGVVGKDVVGFLQEFAEDFPKNRTALVALSTNTMIPEATRLKIAGLVEKGDKIITPLKAVLALNGLLKGG